VDLDRALDRGWIGDVGIPASAELLGYVEAVMAAVDEVDDKVATLPPPKLLAAKQALESSVGTEGLWEAAATVAAFAGLVRVADGTGIQLDEGVLGASADIRARSGIDEFAGAANSATALPRSVELENVHDLFA
jgi:hypothetical protein